LQFHFMRILYYSMNKLVRVDIVTFVHLSPMIKQKAKG